MKNKIIFIFVLFIACNMKNNNNENTIINNMKKNELNLRNEIIKTKNDNLLFKLLISKENKKYIYVDILPEAFYLAENTDSPFAYTMIYIGILELNFPNDKIIEREAYFFQKLPNKEKEIILNYLKKGAELKNASCVKYLIDIYKLSNDSIKVKYYENLNELKYRFW